MIDLRYLKNFMNHIYLYKNFDIRNSRFNLPPVRLDVKRNFTVFLKYEMFKCCSCPALCAQCSTILLNV